MKLRFRKENVVYYLLIFCFLSGALSFYIGKWTMFFADVFVIFGCIVSLTCFNYRRVRLPLVIITVMLVTDVVSLLITGTNLLLWVWGLRNQYRFFLFLLICATLGTLESIDKCKKLLQYSLIINFIIVTFQFFILGIRGDYLGGIFGTEQGCNGVTNIYLAIVLSIYVTDYMSKQLPLKKMAMALVAVLYLATLAELKIFYIEALIIMAIALLLERNLNRKIKIILLAVVTLPVAIAILPVIFPAFENFFNLDYLWYYFTRIGYGSYGFNRYSALDVVNRYIFQDNTLSMIFGLGTGAGEASPINSIASEIYQHFNVNMNIPYYGYLHSVIYVERGWFGLISYVTLILGTGIFSYKQRKKSKIPEFSPLYSTAIIISCVCLLSMVYDSSLRTAASGFMAYWVLSWPYMLQKYEGKIKE